MLVPVIFCSGPVTCDCLVRYARVISGTFGNLKQNFGVELCGSSSTLDVIVLGFSKTGAHFWESCVNFDFGGVSQCIPVAGLSRNVNFVSVGLGGECLSTLRVFVADFCRLCAGFGLGGAMEWGF